MPYPAREQVLIPLQTISASGTSADIPLPEQFTAVILHLKSDAGGGTSPTCNVYIQQKMGFAASGDIEQEEPSGTDVYDDYASFTQITTAAYDRYLRIVGGGGQGTSQDTAASDGALTAGTVRNGAIGRCWRVKWTVTGTSPTFANFQLVAQFIP